MFFAVTVLLIVSVVFYGCKKTEPQTSTVPASVNEPVVEQTTCPVMAGAINKNLFTVYQEKTVYFCCPDCKGKFESEPDKYIAKLPQFAK
jgi:YHS domain-containing protein